MSEHKKIKVECCECEKTFSTKSSLKKHAKSTHLDKLNIIVPPKSYKHQCEICKKNFNRLGHWRHHQKKIHQIVYNQTNTFKTCPLCNAYIDKNVIYDHFTENHGISIKTSILEIASLDEFLTWKLNIEKETKSCFVKSWSGSRPNNKKAFAFSCHRSGHYVTNSKGLRNLKAKGSNKINGYCPASIKVVENEDGMCNINFVETHVGHGGDLGHLFLTLAERELIASKLALKIPFDQILAEIRATAKESDLERIHLLTRKDLFNIQNSFNLRHSNEAIGIKVVVEKIDAENSLQMPKFPAAGNTEESELIVRNDQKVLVDETSQIISSLANNDNSKSRYSLAVKKNRFQEKNIPELIEIIENITRHEELETLKKLMAPIKPTMRAMREKINLDLRQQDSLPHDNKKVPQKRKVIIKHPRKMNTNSREVEGDIQCYS